MVWVGFCSTFTTAAFGDTIKLKSGQEIKADIVNRDQNSIKLETKGIQMTYYGDEIDTINGQAFSGGTAVTVPEITEPRGIIGKEEDSVNLGETNIYIKPPSGWYKRANIQSRSGFIIFNYQKVKGLNKVRIKVAINNPIGDIHRSIDFVRRVKRSIERKAPKFIVKDPTEYMVRELDGSFIEMNSKDNSEFSARYYFLIGRAVLTLQLFDNQGTYQENLKILQDMAASIRVENLKK